MENKELTLRQKLDALVAEGKEIKITWEGGNDSGSYTLYIDGVTIDYYDAECDDIVSHVSDVIDYGSWSGDFYADGYVVYSSDEGAFVGEGRDTESDSSELDDINIEIRVPKALNFDSIEIISEGTYCFGELEVKCRFAITNGPVFSEHIEIQDAMRNHVEDLLDTILRTHKDTKNEEIGWVYNEWSFRRETLLENGDDLVGRIINMDLTINNTKHKSYHIPINNEQ